MKNDKLKANKWKTKKWIVVVVAVLGLLVVFDLSPFGGNVHFYTSWASCGQKPVATAGSGYLNSGAIHYYEPSWLPGLHPTIEYFCTPIEAEQAGYSASPDQYEFPNLQRGA